MDENGGGGILNKGRGFFASLKRTDAAVREADEVVAGIVRFIKTGGSDVAEGKQTLALLTKTARHVNAKHREYMRHSEVTEADKPYVDALLEIAAFFNKLPTIRFKSEPEAKPGEELSEINLELFPSAKTVHISGITVIYVKSGDNITSVNVNSGAGFAEGVSVFPNCTELEANGCVLQNLIDAVRGPVETLRAIQCNVGEDLHCVEKYPGLTTLDLSQCGLTEIPEAVKNLKNLTCLTLADNFIPAVKHVAQCGSLTSLDLSGNKLSDLDGLAIDGAERSPLRSISFSNNPLTHLSGIGPWHCNLSNIDGSSCQINDWGQEVARFARLPVLTNLALTGNPCYHVDPDMGKTARQLVIEHLSDIDDPVQFVLDGEKLSRSEVKMWQEIYKNTAREPPAAECDAEEWPMAIGQEEPRTLVLSEDPPHKSGKTVKKKVKTKTVKQITAKARDDDDPTVVRTTKKKLENKAVQATVRASAQGAQAGGSDSADCSSIYFRILEKVKERLGDDPQYKNIDCTTYANWDNGVGLLALLHSCDPTWVGDFHNLSTKKNTENLARSFELCNVHLKIPVPPEPGIMGTPSLAAPYISLVLLSVQSWEAAQCKKMKRFTERMVSEVNLFRAQRVSDRRTITQLQNGDDLMHTQTQSDSAIDSDDASSDYYSS